MAITGWHEVGKGTKRRPEDRKALDANWDRIFGKKKTEPEVFPRVNGSDRRE